MYRSLIEIIIIIAIIFIILAAIAIPSHRGKKAFDSDAENTLERLTSLCDTYCWSQDYPTCSAIIKNIILTDVKCRGKNNNPETSYQERWSLPQELSIEMDNLPINLEDDTSSVDLTKESKISVYLNNGSRTYCKQEKNRMESFDGLDHALCQ